MYELVDIGVNLTHDSFDADRDQTIARAANVGVRRLIVTGTDVAASRRAHQLTRSNGAALFSTAGIHPHHADQWDADSAAALRALAQQRGVVAIGECGLDFFRDFSPREDQRRAFIAQLEIASECALPVFLHQRDAHDEFLGLLTQYLERRYGGVAHCFTGSRLELEAYLELGLYIGVTGWVCDERRGAALRSAVPHIPLDRLLLETDAPYLLPRDLSPKPPTRRNEPAHLPHILARVSELLGVDPRTVAAATTRNAETLFRLNGASAD